MCGVDGGVECKVWRREKKEEERRDATIKSQPHDRTCFFFVFCFFFTAGVFSCAGVTKIKLISKITALLSN